ncbi:hypothetical protein RvY_02983 [Ramazzottius varieornatus]|uniref:RRM domain-containing protein n=1 Tax=Ramazzottius varieornatus TaxID=947166 RepID=A0A1D1ULK1_RAMVA|nr:hypothetical protein RvY_02983 [Ramazzottius varieornatus]
MADVALDDYIKTKHITRSGKGPRGAARGGARGGRGASSRGGSRGGRFGGGIAKSPVQRRSGGLPNLRTASAGGSGQGRWQHDLFGASPVGAMGGLRSRGGFSGGAKLMVSNLDYGVSDNDLRDLFGELGTLRKASIHYDLSGRSLGTAEIVYQSNSDALQALKRYNGVPLDGQAMEIQLVAPGMGAAMAMGMGAPGGLNLPRRGMGRGAGMRSAGVGGRLGGRGGARGGASGAGRGGRGGQRGGGRGARGGAAGKRTAKPEVTQEQLDMELDAYQTTTA